MQELKAAKRIADLAPLLGHTPSAVAYLARKLPPAQKYHSFTIPKKSGTLRTIDAPIEKLKQLQRRLANLLYDCQEEIEARRKPRRSLSHAFRKNHSILTNARAHTGRRYVLNLDLEDFFPSLNFGRVRGFFIKNMDFALDIEVATVIAQIACHNNALPQGSPCSPIISDLLTHILDVRLAQLAKLNRCTYSRYADDITFSTNEKVFPKPLAAPVSLASASWAIGDALVDEIARAGFSLNHSKTRMQYRTSLQQVTGLTVNEIVNVRASYYRHARVMCHSLFRKGVFVLDGVAHTSVRKLEGIVNHAYHVKTTVPLWSEESRPKEEKPAKPSRDPAVHRLYSRLNFYKYFVDLSQPLIVCEGKTDSLYLKLAIRRLAGAFPSLAISMAGSNKLGIDFFKYGGLPSKLLGIEGGTGHLTSWMADFETRSRLYNKSPTNPVIVLCDSDSGASPILKMIKGKFGKSILPSSPEPFHHLCRNLYLVLTPIPTGSTESCIEDFFDPAVLATRLDGKSFNPTNFDNSPTEYGKLYLAEYVIRPHAKTINFAGFSPLLTRISAACADYATQQNSNQSSP